MTKIIVLGERMSTVKIDQFGTVAKNVKEIFHHLYGFIKLLSVLEHLYVLAIHLAVVLYIKIITNGRQLYKNNSQTYILS